MKNENENEEDMDMIIDGLIKELNSDNDIEFSNIGTDDLSKSILGCEISPHDVEIIIKYKSGKEKKGTVTWEMIKRFAECHPDIHPVHEIYSLLLD